MNITNTANITKKPFGNRMVFGIGCIIGIFSFLVICDYRILDPRNVDWLLAKSDFTLPYYALRFYLRNNMGFRSISGMTYPYNIPLVYSDINIPVGVAIKLLLGENNGDFQCQGIVTLSYFILQGGFAGLIINRIKPRKIFVAPGIVLLCFSPWLIMRIFNHYTLGAHWIILAGFCLWLYKKELNGKSYVLWCVLIPVSSLIHVYFVPILLGMMFFSYLDDFVIRGCWKRAICSEITAGMLSIFAVYLFGGFDTTINIPNPVDGILGKANSNLNTFFNPLQYSQFINGLQNPPGYPFQGFEGYGYLGFGVFILLSVDVLLIVTYRCMFKSVATKEQIKILIVVIACFISFCILAVGYRITFSEKVLLEIELPSFLISIIATFRSMGRFIWVPCYMIVMGSLFIYIIIGERVIEALTVKKQRFLTILQIAVLIMICIIQIVDLKPLIDEKKGIASSTEIHTSAMKDEKWETLGDNHKYVVVMTPGIVALGNPMANDMNLFVLDKNILNP